MTQQLYIRVDDPVPAFVPATLDDIRKAGYVPVTMDTYNGVVLVQYGDSNGEPYGIPARPHSDAKNERDRQEENLAFGARDTLEDARKHYGIPFMMAALRPIAKYFEVDHDELLKGWVRHYAPGVLSDHYMTQLPKIDNNVV